MVSSNQNEFHVAEERATAIESKQDVLLASLRLFYADPTNLRVLTDVLAQSQNKHKHGGGGDGDGGGGTDVRISLRILDWLVTNYAKKNNVVYMIPGEDGDETTFNMFLEYKSQLKAYSKRFFDPFCRRQRLPFQNADGKTLRTTVGQLNFFRWALVNGVIEYGTRHYKAIERDMLTSTRHRDEDDTTTTTKRRRRELSKAAIKGCTRTRVKVVVKFT